MSRALYAFLLLVMAGCGDDDSPMRDSGTGDGGIDVGMDSGVDAGTADAGPQLPSLSGLGDDVRAVQDARGMWHIYGSSVPDVLEVQGYLQARDRWGQMAFLRRAVRGELSELVGAALPSLFDDDVAARFAGYRRHAEATWTAIQAEHPDVAAALVAFTRGINAYITQVEGGVLELPRGVRDSFDLISLTDFNDWTVVDTLAIAKFQAAALSLDAERDIERSLALTSWAAAFPSGSADARVAARSDAYFDLFPFAQTQGVYTRGGFPNVGTDTTTRAIVSRLSAARPSLARRLPSIQALRNAVRLPRAVEAQIQAWFGDRSRGSNSWVVASDRTAGGSPLLANDPHLSLTSPALFWMVHLNTKGAGGDLNVAGLALAGTPGVLLGFNDDIAWGLTTHNFDVTDAYRETITPVAGGPDTALFDPDPDDANPPEQRPLVTITESIIRQTDFMGGSEVVDIEYELVPIGPASDPMAATRIILPETREDTEAISLRWTGFGATREIVAVLAVNRATNVDEASDALEDFQAGGQNWVIVDEDDIYWTTACDLPVRDPRAMTFDPTTQTGFGPSFVLPGTGEYEWLRSEDATLGAGTDGFLDDRYLPHDRNPANGYIATANNDGVGTVDDDNPFNDDFYIGAGFAEGHRIARIRERLDELVGAGEVTPEDMRVLQGDTKSPIGTLTRDAIVAELVRAAEEAATPGTHTDLATYVAGLDAATVARLDMARSQLEAWSLETPAAVEGTPAASEIADSAAASIFNASMGRIHRALIDDEADVLYAGVDCATLNCPRPFTRLYVWALSDPERLASYDAGIGDTILWDDLSTVEVETRGTIVVQAVAEALAWLETDFGSVTMDDWRWGALHTLRFATIVPQIGVDQLSIPTMADEIVPGGWPRPGDRGVVDASSFSARAIERGSLNESPFRYASGPVQRLVVEMTPAGPLAWNALPGGNAQDPDSPHHADEAALWRTNQAPRVWFTDAEVEANTERTWVWSAP